MKIRIRLPVIAFAVVSAIYWFVILELWIGILQLQGGWARLPYWQSVVMSTVPPMLYALACLLFCRWLVLRSVRRAMSQKESDVS